MRKRIILAIVLVLGIGTLAGSCDEKGLGDAPVGEALEDERTIIVMPDTFPNLALVCDATTRLYVNTRDGGYIGVVPDHPACQDAPPLEEQGESVDVPEGDG